MEASVLEARVNRALLCQQRVTLASTGRYSARVNRACLSRSLAVCVECAVLCASAPGGWDACRPLRPSPVGRYCTTTTWHLAPATVGRRTRRRAKLILSWRSGRRAITLNTCKTSNRVHNRVHDYEFIASTRARPASRATLWQHVPHVQHVPLTLGTLGVDTGHTWR